MAVVILHGKHNFPENKSPCSLRGAKSTCCACIKMCNYYVTFTSTLAALIPMHCPLNKFLPNLCVIKLYRLCHLDKDESQPHKQNQKILYNTGWYDTLLYFTAM